jgi:hypothetical protein
MRKLMAAVVAAGLSLGSAALLDPAIGQEGDPGQLGAFSAPFREDGQPDSPDTAGCTELPDGTFSCLPAAASTVVLPNGRILYWNALEGTENISLNAVAQGGDVTVDDQSRVLDLNADNPGASTWLLTDPSAGGGNPEGNNESDVGAPDDAARNDGGLFCTSHVHMGDGRVLVLGGTDYYQDPRLTPEPGFGVIELEGLKAARIFNPADNTWAKAGSMNWGRWYPSAVTLANGDVFVASGVTKLLKPIYTDEKNLPNSGKNVPQTETYEQAKDAWVDNGPSGERTLPLYPRIHLLPNGKVYYDAGGQVFNPMGQAYDEVLWNLAAVYDPATKSWSDLGVPGLDTGNPTQIGFRGSTFSIMLPLQAPYDKASFLSAGGIVGTSPGTVLAIPSSRINTVTVGADGTESLATTSTGSLSQGRWYSTGVLLPDGSVFAVSGADVDEVVGPGDGRAVRQAELFTPDGDGGGTWAPAAGLSHDRTYHNTAVLLPDGRVLVGGHSPIPNNYSIVLTLPGGFSNNSRDASFEIYSPPYLFRGDRPEIGNVNQEVQRGQELVIPTKDAESIESVVLVRNPSLTHLVDADQRSVELPIVSKAGGNVKVSVPDNPAVLPGGPYMLFINKGSDDGLIPSVSRQVAVGVPLPAYLRNAGGPGTAVQGVQVEARSAQAGGQTLPATGARPSLATAGLTVLLVATAAYAIVRRTRPTPTHSSPM